MTLVDVLKRHPEWKRRLKLTMQAKLEGRKPPEFPLLLTCYRCGQEFPKGESKAKKVLCPKCRPSWGKNRSAI